MTDIPTSNETPGLVAASDPTPNERCTPAGVRPAKTGGQDSAWVELEKPKPPPVEDRYAYWLEPPPTLSPRCEYWLRQIERGWRPNRRIAAEGYDNAAEWYGVYIWEYLNAITPALAGVVSGNGETP